MQTKFIALALLSATSVFGANIQQRQNQPNLSDAFSVVGSVVQGKATAGASSLASHIASITSVGGAKASAAIYSHWSQATSAIESIDNRIDRKYSSITGYTDIESNLRSAIAGGTSNVAAFFSTQTAVAASAASSIQGDVAAAIISAATASENAPSASASTSGNAATAPRVAAGAVAGVVGILAGILAL
ncbi:hypothetical protein BDD12DRAFT_802664 [Trichophaea hybrida]|nr:hypothetical protein BDD12DRAFT_802664 [Trichophaea hybrida]